MTLSQLFLWGFEGVSLSQEMKRLLREYPPAGVILFRRNLENKDQIRGLTRELRQAAGRPILIGIDEEGGRVGRLPDPLEHFPPAATYGEGYRKTKRLNPILRSARRLGRQLRLLGINTDFAPVLDVNSNPKNPIIGDRAFSENPAIVAKTAVAFYEGLKSVGIVACGKHFPGHGDTATDSHLELPRVDRSKKDLGEVELVPFRAAICQHIPLLMTAHVIYKALDPAKPATFSKKILMDLLRKKLGYQGLVVSDDLHMKAVSAKHSLVESSVLSLAAGVDLVLICREGEKGGEIVEAVSRIVVRSPVLKKRVEESYRRVSALVKNLW